MNRDTSSERYAVIVSLAEQLSGGRRCFGKTALMKFMYLLQAIHNIPLGYRFKLYTYGPFTPEVLRDLDHVDFFHGISVNDRDDVSGGYEILPEQNAARFKSDVGTFLTTNQAAIDSLVKNFRDKSAKELELISTLVFLEKTKRQEGEQITRRELVDTVRSIKPKFSEADISAQIASLENLGYISFN